MESLENPQGGGAFIWASLMISEIKAQPILMNYFPEKLGMKMGTNVIPEIIIILRENTS